MVKTEQKIQSESSNQMLSKSTASSSAPPTSSSSLKKKKYKGVRMRSWGSWVSEIRAPNQKTRIWLGSYSTPEAAARAYDAALLCLKGTSANFNFPITSSHCIPDTTLSPKCIQRVAAAAANNFSDNNKNETTPPVFSPPLDQSSPSTSSSSISSPSMSDQVDDDVSLIQSFGSTSCMEPMSMTDSWFNFDDFPSPKFVDLMFTGESFNPPMIDDYFEGDFRLWSFAD